MDIETIMRELKSLPLDKQREVYDFIAFLKDRIREPQVAQQDLNRKLAEEAFIGLWKDRKDMKDSSLWVRRTRKEEWMG
ncbi:MAG: DUF2281 domain-containing protein [Deltaproteobacteria bacterium]|nr:MAG: DUF2281 domain-containing protein [Deltaproteobacteria bacterium]